MARDEALIELASRTGRPVLRTYGWTVPAATFGYFQRYADVAALTPLRPLIRRPTGGGLVPHDADWTYSVIMPPDTSWYDLKAVESYRQMHEWIQAALQSVGVESILAPCCLKEGPGQCFVGAEQFDLLLEGRKIAGAAQRRRKDGLLIQGSIQAAGLRVTRPDFEQAFREVAARRWDIHWEDFAPEPPLAARVAELLQEKYSREEYHQRMSSLSLPGPIKSE
jgi:lipoate-protein ligase A